MQRRHGVSILCTHHTSKSVRVYPVDEVSGTLGLTGAADAVLVFKRARRAIDATQFVTGRDIEEERELALTTDFDKNIWQSHGAADCHHVRRERHDVLELLGRHPQGLRPRELGDLLAKSGGAMRALLWKMAEDGQITTDTGRYINRPEKKENVA